MKRLEKRGIHPVVESLRTLMIRRKLKQAYMAECAGVSASQFSKILKGDLQISLWQLSNMATKLDMQLIDILFYPDEFVNKKTVNNTERISVTFEVPPDKRDILLNLVTGKEDSSNNNK